MIALEVRTYGVADLSASLMRAGDRLHDAQVAIATEGAELLEAETKRQIQADDLLFRRRLLNSIESKVRDEGKTVSALTYSEEPYAIVMEDGRAPGGKQPPTDDMIPWVVKRIGVAGARLSGRARSSARNPGAVERAVRGLAFVVARSIARKGIRARKFFEKAAREVEALLPRIADRIVTKFADDFEAGK